MLISIVLPVYNGEKYLAMSIESCLNQTYENIELIIVNDCSTDDTLGIANRFAESDNRVKIINNRENKKLPASLNIGHREAKGDLLTWTSDDNIFELNALEIMLNVILEKNVDIAYSNFYLIDNDGYKIREVELLGIENIIFGNCISCCFLYKKEVFLRNIGYDENLFLAEDYDFWLRSLLHSRFFQIKRALYSYRKHSDSLTNQIAVNKEKKKLWMNSICKMYTNFCESFFVYNNKEITKLLVGSLTHQNISFIWFRSINDEIKKFKVVLKENQNFSNERLFEQVFLNKSIELITLDKSSKTNFSKSIFVIKEYFYFLNKNAIKTLIKYSFFK
jgi:glycosyltransferase involved in cell wall biosynthesis